MFLGMDAFSGKLAMTPNYTSADGKNDIQINSGDYSKVYLTTDPTEDADTVGELWTYNTLINANYKRGLDAGNSIFSLKNTDEIVIKIREDGALNWTTIYTVPIENEDDFNFFRIYPYASNDTDYEVMAVSMVNGVENGYVTANVKTKFRGICLTDTDNFYATELNIEAISVTQNIQNSTLPLLHNAYPVVVSNGESNYASGTITALFIQFDENCDPILGIDGMRYRRNIINWLSNKKAKVLKFDDGLTKMVRIVGTPSVNESDHHEIKTITFDWVEVGDVSSEKDMYKNGLSDIQPGKY